MGLPNVLNTGHSGMMAAKAGVATSGHNVANANTEGYSRQRVQTTTNTPRSVGSKGMVGTGTLIDRVDRINDEYIEKQVRNSGRDLAHMEEKDLMLKQVEDIFNEMDGEGLNRLMSKFFNEFRKLGNDPDSEAVRQSVREASQAMVSDFRRLRKEVEDVRMHIDARIEGQVGEINALATEIKDMNIRIKTAALGGAAPNDLLDKRDQLLRKLGSYMDLSMHKDNHGNFIVDIRGVGPLIAGPEVQRFAVERSPADDQGKPENALDVKSSSSANSIITHSVKGGKMGALLSVRDNTLSTIMERLDELAYGVSESVNQIHRQGFSRNGVQGIDYFKQMDTKHRAAEFIGLSDHVSASVNNIAAALVPDAPGDNRIAVAIANVQNLRLMNEGKSSMDDYFNSIVSDVGVLSARNKSTMNQQRDIQQQLGKMRDQISGVSIDEETTNLLQYQHVFDASAKVISVADEMLKTVLDLRR